MAGHRVGHVAGVDVAGRRIDDGSWSIDSGGRNVIEGNRIQLRTGQSLAKAGTRSPKKPGSVAGECIDS